MNSEHIFGDGYCVLSNLVHTLNPLFVDVSKLGNPSVAASWKSGVLHYE